MSANKPKQALKEYQIFEFINSDDEVGGETKIKEIEFAPKSWISFDEEKLQLYAKFMPPVMHNSDFMPKASSQKTPPLNPQVLDSAHLGNQNLTEKITLALITSNHTEGNTQVTEKAFLKELSSVLPNAKDWDGGRTNRKNKNDSEDKEGKDTEQTG